MDKKSRKLPIGVQSFESLRSDGYLYVGKEKYLYELVHSSKQFFLSRPRCFARASFCPIFVLTGRGERSCLQGWTSSS